MRLIRLLLLLTLLAGCANTTSPGPTQVSCQPYGSSPVPITLSFAPRPATAASAEQTAVALIRSCAATPDSASITITIIDLTSNVKGGTGGPSGPNSGEAVWLVQIDTTEAEVKGGTSLARQLRLGVFAALDQRIAVRYHIGPMDLGDSTAYLRHHLALAGRSDQLFADDAIVRLHRQSNGIPRALNNAAVAALIAAAADGKEIVDDACAKKAVAELTRD